MEESRIPKTEGEAEPQRDQEHTHRVFQHSRDGAPWICPRRPDGERRVLLQYSSPSERGHSAKMTWTVARGQLAAPWWQCTLSPSTRNAFLAHNSIITLPYPPYSPDLAPCDFFLFPKMKLQIKGHLFDRVEEIQGGFAERSWYASRTGLLARVPAVATALESMCRCTRGLLWRGCYPNLNQVNTF